MLAMPLELGGGEDLLESPLLPPSLEEGDFESPSARDSGGKGGSTTSLTSRVGAGADAGGSICSGTKPSREPGCAGKIVYGNLALRSEHGLPVIPWVRDLLIYLLAVAGNSVMTPSTPSP